MNESQNTCIWLSNVHPSVEGRGYRIGGGHSKLSHSKEGNTHYFRGQVVWECYVTPHLHVGSTMCLLVLLSSDRLATAPCEVCLGPVPLAKANTHACDVRWLCRGALITTSLLSVVLVFVWVWEITEGRLSHITWSLLRNMFSSKLQSWGTPPCTPPSLHSQWAWYYMVILHNQAQRR